MRKYTILLILIISLVMLSQLVLAGRYYDSRTGRFLQIDPNSDKYPNLSPYAYCADNPLKYIDPDGKDIIIVHDPKGAGGRGHNALLVGNSKTGYAYYSKDGVNLDRLAGGVGPNTIRTGFKSIEEFSSSENGSRYSTAVEFKTGESQDDAARSKAYELINVPYSDKTECADLTGEATRSAGIDLKDEKRTETITIKIAGVKVEIPLIKYTDPIKQINNAKNVDGAKVINLEEQRKKEVEKEQK